MLDPGQKYQRFSDLILHDSYRKDMDHMNVASTLHQNAEKRNAAVMNYDTKDALTALKIIFLMMMEKV